MAQNNHTKLGTDEGDKNLFRIVNKNKIIFSIMIQDFIKNIYGNQFEYINYTDFNKLKFNEKINGNKIIYKYDKKYNTFWFRKQKKDGISPMKLTIELRNKFYKNYKIVARKITRNYFFGCVNVDTLTQMVQKNYHLYEVITTNEPRKIYIDVDGMKEYKFILNELKNILPDIKFSISGSCGQKGKIKDYYSYHITSNNYYFNNHTAMSDSMKSFIKYINKKYKIDKGKIDSGIYDRNRQFKMINQSKEKKDKRLQLVILDNCNENHFVTHIDNNMIKINDQFNKFIIWEMNEEPNIKMKSSSNENISKDIQLNKIEKIDTIQPNIDLDKDRPIRILSHISNKQNLGHIIYFKVMLWCKKNNIGYETFYKWACQPWTHNNKFYMEWKNKYNMDHKLNITTENTIKPILESQYGPIINYKLEQFKKSFLENKDYDLLIDEDRILCNHFINKTEKYTVICAGMGKGKTYSLLDYIEENTMNYIKKSKFKSVLWITNRCSLADDISGNAKSHNGIDLKFLKYNEDLTDFNNTKKLICEIESLVRFKNYDFDIIVCDEIESLFNSFLTNTCHIDYLECYKKFYKLLKKSKKVFLMDAYISNRTINFIKDIDCNESILKIKTTNNNFQKRTITQYRDLKGGLSVYKWLFDLVEDLKNNKKIYVYYPHKRGKGSILKMNKVGLGIEELKIFLKNESGLKNENFRTYHSDSQNKSDLKNVNKIWADEKIKCILTNSSISVGVSYQPRDEYGDEIESARFDKIYLSYESFINPRDVVQTSCRVRNPRDKNIKLCYLLGLSKLINGKNTQEPYELPFCMDDLELFEKRQDYESMKNGLVNLYDSLKLEYNCKGEECLNFLFRMSEIKITKIIYSEKSFKDWFNGMANNKIKKELEANPIWNYDKIKNINHLEYKSIDDKVRGSWTSLEALRVRKYKLIKSFKKDTDPEHIKYFWDNPNVLEGYKKLNWDFNSIHMILNSYKKKFNENDDIEDIINIKKKLTESERNNIYNKYLLKNNLTDNKIIINIFNLNFGRNSLQMKNGELIFSNKFKTSFNLLKNIIKKKKCNQDLFIDDKEFLPKLKKRKKCKYVDMSTYGLSSDSESEDEC